MSEQIATPNLIDVDDTINVRQYARLDQIDTARIAKHLIAYTPTNDEVDRLFQKAQIEIGTMTTLPIVKRVISSNPDTFHALGLRRRHNIEKPQAGGFISWLPLTHAGRTELLKGSFDGSDPDPNHIAGQHETPAAIYIWGIYAPGRLAVGIAWAFQRWSTPLCQNADIYARAVTATGLHFARRIGFEPVSKTHNEATPKLLVFRRAPKDDRPIYDSYPSSSSRYTVTVVRTHDALGKVMAVRSAVYMAEQLCPYDEEFDGNDFSATHLLGFVEDEPAASIRIRCFAEFAKVERLAVRREHRRSRLALLMIRAAKELCRMKGYTRIYGQAQKRLVSLWSRSGARPIPDAKEFTFSDFDYVEMLLETEAHPDAITLGADPYKIIRPEGRWHNVGVLEKSRSRPVSRPSVEGVTVLPQSTITRREGRTATR